MNQQCLKLNTECQIKIVSWNVSSIKQQTLKLVKQFAPHIFCLQECRQAKLSSSPSYYLFHCHNSQLKNSGGIITGIHKSFTSNNCSDILKLPIQITFDYVIINARNEYCDLFIFNFYFNNRENFRKAQEHLKKWFSEFIFRMKPNQRIFLLGDFNQKNNPFDIFYEVIPKQQMTFQRYKLNQLVQSRTDHILILPTCQLSSEYQFNKLSDHALLYAKFNFQQKISHQFYFYKFNKSRAYQLNNLASSKFSDFTCFYNFIFKNMRSHKVIQKIKRKIIPKLERNDNNSYNNLWDQLSDLLKNNRTEFYQKLKKIAIMNPNKKEGGMFSYFLDEQDNLQFGDAAYDNCLSQLSLISNRQKFNPLELPTLQQLSTIDIQEIQQLISSNKAISFDGISDSFIKKTKNITLFLDIWSNSTLETNQLCCRARLIPLNKVFPSIPRQDQFRPITILSSLYKLLELRFLPKLQCYLNNRLSKDQTGFIPFSSTQINITNLLNLINSFTKNSKKNCIFIDFTCAFNTVNRDILYNIISQKNILEELELEFLQKLLSHIHYISPLTNEIYYFANGLPQGSPLSPALFNIYLEEFLFQQQEICQIDYKSFQFADDIVTIIDHKDTKLNQYQLSQLSLKFNLKINKQKCGLFMLHNHTPKLKINLTFYDFPIVQHYKYLGIWISSNGKVLQHLKQLKQTINYLISKILWISKACNWKFKFQLWQTFILPHIIYFNPSVLTQRHKICYNKLKSIYLSRFKKICGFPPSLPNQVVDFLISPFNFICNRSINQIRNQINYHECFSTQFLQLKDCFLDQVQTYNILKYLPENFNYLFKHYNRIFKIHQCPLSYVHIINYHSSFHISELLVYLMDVQIQQHKKRGNFKQRLRNLIDKINTFAI